jgi:hypothetical protein
VLGLGRKVKRSSHERHGEQAEELHHTLGRKQIGQIGGTRLRNQEHEVGTFRGDQRGHELAV